MSEGTQNNGAFYYLKIRVDDLRDWCDFLDDPALAAFIRAIRTYIDTGKKQDVPEAIMLQYRQFVRYIDASRIKADKLHAARVDAGRAGGIAKSRNTKEAQDQEDAQGTTPAADPPSEKTTRPSPPASRTPDAGHPSKKEVQAIFKKLKAENLIQLSATLRDVNVFYENLEAQDWRINGVPVRDEAVLQKVMLYRWSAYYSAAEKKTRLETYLAIVNALDGRDPESGGIKRWDLLADAYDEITGTWTINGATYTTIDEAAKAFVANARYCLHELSQNSGPNCDTTNLNGSDKGICGFGVTCSNPTPAFQVKKTILNEVAQFV